MMLTRAEHVNRDVVYANDVDTGDVIELPSTCFVEPMNYDVCSLETVVETPLLHADACEFPFSVGETGTSRQASGGLTLRSTLNISPELSNLVLRKKGFVPPAAAGGIQVVAATAPIPSVPPSAVEAWNYETGVPPPYIPPPPPGPPTRACRLKSGPFLDFPTTSAPIGTAPVSHSLLQRMLKNLSQHSQYQMTEQVLFGAVCKVDGEERFVVVTALGSIFISKLHVGTPRTPIFPHHKQSVVFFPPAREVLRDRQAVTSCRLAVTSCRLPSTKIKRRLVLTLEGRELRTLRGSYDLESSASIVPSIEFRV